MVVVVYTVISMLGFTGTDEETAKALMMYSGSPITHRGPHPSQGLQAAQQQQQGAYTAR